MKKKQLIVSLVCMTAMLPLSAKDLKVLMIGNSFSVCVGNVLPKIVKSAPDHSLELTSCYISGCTLDRHSEILEQAEKQPDLAPYSIKVWNSGDPAKPKSRMGNVNELLKKNQYDIVTIQQGSTKCWDYKTYQPYANRIIGYIRKYQPKAEIVIQQTWAYRSDDLRLQPAPGARWDFDQQGMYRRLREAYEKLAEACKFRVIPTGDAVQLYRKYTPVKFKPSTEQFQYPALPSSAGDPVGKAFWRKAPKTGEYFLAYDQYHLNRSGEYLQSCLWFAFLYGEPVSKIAYTPSGISESENKLIRKCAQEALDGYKQVK